MASIFIVEDEFTVQKLYNMILTAFGYDVIGIAKNGEEAVQMFEAFSKKPDVIIMDHRMPIKDGLEASKEILKINKNAKIIFASADASIEEHTRSLGIVSFKLKPFSNERLIMNIEKALKCPKPQIGHEFYNV